MNIEIEEFLKPNDESAIMKLCVISAHTPQPSQEWGCARELATLRCPFSRMR